MRNLILILVLANLLVYFWFQWLVVPQVNDGSQLRQESDLVPRLDQGAAAAQSSVSKALPLCLSIGDFEDLSSAEAFAATLPEGAGEVSVFELQVEAFVGHWVQVVDIKSRSAADAQQQQLEQGGLSETYLTGNDASGYVLSLGLFTDLARAQAVQDKAQALGIAAITLERTRPKTMYRLNIQEADKGLFEPLIAESEQLSAVACDETAPAES